MSPRIFNQPLRILLSTNALVLIASAMFIPIYALFVDDIGGDIFDVGYTAAVFAVAAGLMTLISGNITDRVKRKELLVVIGYMTVGIGFVSYMFVETLTSLIIVQALVGFGLAFYAPAFDVLYTNNLREKKSGIQWAAWESMDYFTSAIGALIGASIVSLLGFDAMFLVMAALCFASAVYIYFLPKRTL